MSNPELGYHPLMLALAKGERPKGNPPAEALGRPTGSGWSVVERGTHACDSKNWPPMYMSIVLGKVLRGLPAPPQIPDAASWIFGWWIQYFREAFDGQAMHGEAGSRIYGDWIQLSVCLVHKLVREYSGDDHSREMLDEIQSLAEQWLEAFWSYIALGAAAGGDSRYLDQKQTGWVTTTTGARTWSRKLKGRHLDLNLLGYRYTDLRRGQVPDWVRKQWGGQMWSLCAPLQLLRASMEQSTSRLVEQIGTWGFMQPIHLIAWADGRRASVLHSARGLSGATAPAYAVTAKPGTRLRVLYADSGGRSAGDVRMGTADLELDQGMKGRMIVTVHRVGVADEPVHPADVGLYTHPSPDKRLMVLHEGGSELLYHVIVDRNGARMAGTLDEPSRDPEGNEPDPDHPSPEPSPPSVDVGDPLSAIALLQAWRQRPEATQAEDDAGAIGVRALEAASKNAPLRHLVAMRNRARRMAEELS